MSKIYDLFFKKSRIENLSITGLLSGKAPYIVAYFEDDNNAKDHYIALLDETDWAQFLITDGDRFSLVLYKLGKTSFDSGETFFECPIIELIANIGLLTLNVARGKAKPISMCADKFNQLASGNMSNNEVLEYIK